MLPYETGKESAFDLSTYFGRLKHFKALADQRY